MKEKQIAEAYVYKKRPALMKHVGPKDAPKSKPGAIFTYHPINLQDWLAVLDNMLYIVDGMGNLYLLKMMMNWKVPKIVGEPLLKFNLTTGQPNSPQDYANFNQIVNNYG